MIKNNSRNSLKIKDKLNTTDGWGAAIYLPSTSKLLNKVKGKNGNILFKKVSSVRKKC